MPEYVCSLCGRDLEKDKQGRWYSPSTGYRDCGSDDYWEFASLHVAVEKES